MKEIAISWEAGNEHDRARVSERNRPGLPVRPRQRRWGAMHGRAEPATARAHQGGNRVAGCFRRATAGAVTTCGGAEGARPQRRRHHPPEEFAAGTAPSIIRSAAARATGPLRGTVRVIVVLVDFSDRPMMQTQQHFQDLFFSQGKPKKSVREYYSDVTHGLIDLQGDVVGPLRLPKTLKTYANRASGMGTAVPNAQTMAFDAVTAADPMVDFTPYDNDGNGFVDAFIVIHAGPGAEVTGSQDDIWSHKWVLPGGARAVDQTKIYAYLTVPEDCKIGVCAHELGHLLFGFPDLYDTDYIVGRHRQLVPDGGRQLGRRRRPAGAPFGLVQGQPGLGDREDGRDERPCDARGCEDFPDCPSSVEERHYRQRILPAREPATDRVRRIIAGRRTAGLARRRCTTDQYG